MAKFLNSLSAEDLGVFVNNAEFIAVQTMRERYRWEVSWRGGFGHRGPLVRTKRPADDDSMSFSFILLKDGVASGMNSYQFFFNLNADGFEVHTKKGRFDQYYGDCIWTDLDLDTSLDQVMCSLDVSIPGYQNIADTNPNT